MTEDDRSYESSKAKIAANELRQIQHGTRLRLSQTGGYGADHDYAELAPSHENWLG